MYAYSAFLKLRQVTSALGRLMTVCGCWCERIRCAFWRGESGLGLGSPVLAGYGRDLENPTWMRGLGRL